MIKTVQLTEKQIKFIMRAIWAEEQLQRRTGAKTKTYQMALRLKHVLTTGKKGKCLAK